MSESEEPEVEEACALCICTTCELLFRLGELLREGSNCPVVQLLGKMYAASTALVIEEGPQLEPELLRSLNRLSTLLRDPETSAEQLHDALAMLRQSYGAYVQSLT